MSESKQKVSAQDHSCLENFEGNGKTIFYSLDCFINYGSCKVCGREMREEFKYSATYYTDTMEEVT